MIDASAIAPYVIQVLTRSRFFDALDYRLCPEVGARARCAGDFSLSDLLLDQIGFPSEDKADIFAVLADRGAHCDCEILYNVVLTSRLKDEFGRAHPEAKGRRFSHASRGTL